MFEHLPDNLFTADLIQAHLESEVGRGELRDRMNEMMEELQRKNPALTDSITAALSMAPSDEARYGFLSGAFYILVLLDRKFSSEDLARRLRE